MEDTLERYKQIRKIGMEVVNIKLTKFIVNKYSKALMLGAAQKLGMLEGKNTIALNDKEETQYIFDFAINEMKREGKKGIELFRENEEVQDELEIEFMDAIENSYTSLFRVVNTSPNKGLIFIKNLLGDGKNIRLTDISLSQINDKDILIFTRIFPFKDINITSGMACIFDSNYEMELMRLYKQHMKNFDNNDSEERFKFFYNQFQRIGINSFTQEI